MFSNYNAETFVGRKTGPSDCGQVDRTSVLQARTSSRSVAERVAEIRAAHPEHAGEPVPSDLVTCSGSGFNPHISPRCRRVSGGAFGRENTGKSEEEIRAIIRECTDGPQFGILGDATVNVLKVNLMLDGIL